MTRERTAFSRMLNEFIREKELTIRILSDRSSLSPSFIADMENGYRRPRSWDIGELFCLFDALDLEHTQYIDISYAMFQDVLTTQMERRGAYDNTR